MEINSLEPLEFTDPNDISFFEVASDDPSGIRFVLIVDTDRRAYWMKLDSNALSFLEVVDFEEVFENSPPDVQEEFSYHFDILR